MRHLWAVAAVCCLLAVNTCVLGEIECTFDDDCDLEYENEAVSWETTKGPSFPGANTGPRFDQTTGRSTGRYAYVTPYDGSEPYGTARLVSERQSVSESLCLTFWYMASSTRENRLAVYKLYNHDEEEQLLEIPGNSAPRTWTRAVLNINHEGSLQVVLEARIYRKSLYGSYGNIIAVDDIRAAEGSCSTMMSGDEEPEIRLVGGESEDEGRVEVYHDQQWKPVCNDGWGAEEAGVVCMHLGYSGSRTQNLAQYDDSYRPEDGYWLSDLSCPAGAQALHECTHRGWGEHECSPGQYATVRCSENDPTDAWRRLQIVDYEVVGSAIRGRVLVNHQRQWGGVCDQGWDDYAAAAVCRTLGFMGEGRALRPGSGLYEEGDEISVISEVDCGRRDRDFLQCERVRYEVGDCTPVGVECNFGESNIPYACEFGRDDSCGIVVNTRLDEPSWQLRRARDVDRSIEDHTTGDRDGYVLYASGDTGSEMVAVTEPFLSSGAPTQCLTFFYLYTDSEAPQLAVYRKYKRHRNLVWQRTHYSGDRDNWLEVNVDIDASEFSLVFVATAIERAGREYDGEIVIDDVTVRAGGCATDWTPPGMGDDDDDSNDDDDDDSDDDDEDDDDSNDDDDDDTASNSDDDDDDDDRPTRPAAPTPPRDRSVFIEENFDDSSRMDTFMDLSTVLFSYDSDSTSSRNTGPEDDHTSPVDTNMGGYRYLEASGRDLGDRAQYCTLDDIDRRGDDSREDDREDEDRCIMLYRHMYSVRRDNMGELNVYVVPRCTDGRLTSNEDSSYTEFPTKTLLASYNTYDRSASWAGVAVSIPGGTLGRGSHVVLEARRGDGYQSDIAVDDFSVSRGLCCYPDSYRCGFERSEECCYQRGAVVTSSLRWDNHHNLTHTNRLEPTTDRRGNTDGGFMVLQYHTDDDGMEVVGGACVDLHTPQLPHLPSRGRHYSLGFWSYMRGSDVGTLYIYASPPFAAESDMRLIETYEGSSSGSSSDEYWMYRQVSDIRAGEVVTFRGCVPSSSPSDQYYSHIAVDDVDFTIEY